MQHYANVVVLAVYVRCYVLPDSNLSVVCLASCQQPGAPFARAQQLNVTPQVLHVCPHCSHEQPNVGMRRLGMQMAAYFSVDRTQPRHVLAVHVMWTRLGMRLWLRVGAHRGDAHAAVLMPGLAGTARRSRLSCSDTCKGERSGMSCSASSVTAGVCSGRECSITARFWWRCDTTVRCQLRAFGRAATAERFIAM